MKRTICLIPLLMCAMLLYAQDYRLFGMVSDEAGIAFLPGAVIELTSLSSGQSQQTISNEFGVYFFEAIPDGTYRISSSLKGFEAVEAEFSFEDGSRRFDLTLPKSISSATETEQAYRLFGMITSNANEETLAGVVVKLTDLASGEEQAAFTNEYGIYIFEQLEDGAYALEANYVGHEMGKQDIVFKDGGRRADFSLTQDALLVEAVDITGRKASVRTEGSKRIYEIASMPALKSTNLSQVLDAMPSVEVDELQGVVKVRGAEPTLLVNGKPVNRTVGAVLRSINSGQIQSIEIDNSPTAKYAAEGSGGIINIILKENLQKGFNGDIDLTASNLLSNGYIGLNYNSPKVSLSIEPTFTYFDIDYTRFRRANYPSQTTQVTDYQSNYIYDNYDVSVGLDYYLDSTNTFFLSGYLYKEGIDESFTGKFFNQEFPAVNVTDFTSELNYDVPGYTVGLGYQKEFKNPEQNLLLDLTYEFYTDREDFDYLYSNGLLPNNLRLVKNGGDDFLYNAQLDYTQPVSENSQLGIGGSYFLNAGDDFSRFFDVENNNAIEQPQQFNSYDEYNQVSAAYLSFVNNTSKVSTNVGLRLEHTLLEVDLINASLPSAVNQEYSNLFPSAQLGYNFNENNSLNLAYGRRITRPDGLTLNPFVNEADTSKLWAGNPNLQPEFIDAFEITYQSMFENGSLIITPYFRLVEDLVRFSGTVNENNVVVVIPDNFGDSQTMGVESSFSYSVGNWLGVNLSGNFNRIALDESIPNLINDNINQVVGRYGLDFYLPSDLTFTTSGRLTAAQDTYQGNMHSSSFFVFGLDKTLFDGNGGLALQARNPFDTDDFEVELQTADFVDIFEDFVTDNSFYNLNFYYSFGNASQKKQKKQISQFEDRGNGDDITEN